MKLRKSRTSPIFSSFIIARVRSRTSPHSDCGTYTRLAAEHFCPWYSNPPRAIATATSCGSADACATMKSLPPVSPTRRGYERYLPMFSPTFFHMLLKTLVLPVK